jgi:uncharacterized protein YbjT (DUF2867 family)
MRLTIFGATGRVGRHLVEQAAAVGHEVTAVVRNPGKLTAGVRKVTADLGDPDPVALTSAIDGADAVLSGLGPRKKAEHGIVSQGTRAIAAAMRDTGARRLLVISGVGVATVPTPSRPDPPRREPGAGFLMRYLATPMARLTLGGHFTDTAMMEDLIRQSALDWTIMRIPYVVDKPPRGVYRTAYGQTLRNPFRIAAADAAHLMLRLAGQPEAVGKVVTVAY